MSAAFWLGWFTVPVLAFVAVLYAKRRWPSGSPAAQRWQQRSKPFPALSLIIRSDDWVYTALGRCVGPLAGAKATLVPSQQVVGGPSLGKVRISFAYGDTHTVQVAMRNAPQVRRDIARFNAVAAGAATGPGHFRRTRPVSVP